MSEKEWDGGVLTASEEGNAIRRQERQALRRVGGREKERELGTDKEGREGGREGGRERAVKKTEAESHTLRRLLHCSPVNRLNERTSDSEIRRCYHRGPGGIGSEFAVSPEWPSRSLQAGLF